MTNIKSLAAAAALLLGSTGAHAVIIDMEGIAGPNSETTESSSTNTFNGFDVFVGHGHYVDGLVAGSRPNNGTDWLIHDHATALSPNVPVTVTQNGGGIFSASAIDVSEWDSSLGLGHMLTLTGHHNGGGTTVLNFTTDNAFGFETINFNLTNLDSLDIIGSSATQGNCAGFAVCGSLGYDNIVVNAGRQVPEPGTLALFSLGLLGFGAAKRRKF